MKGSGTNTDNRHLDQHEVTETRFELNHHYSDRQIGLQKLLLMFCTVVILFRLPGMVAESVDHWSRVREIVSSNPGRVKPMTLIVVTFMLGIIRIVKGLVGSVSG